MIAAKKIAPLMEEEKNILRILLYFDIFNYPLTEDELERFAPSLPIHLALSLENLRTRGLTHMLDRFYSVQNNLHLARRRQNGNQLAEKKMKAAKRFSQLISFMPFVRAVMLSGSISKGFMDEKSDIDYFIITAQGRLWIARTALVLFRRLFLFNSRKNLCTNYFIDEATLEIEEKNIFTAVEITTLTPMFGKDLIHQFSQANAWCDRYFPNRIIQNELSQKKEAWVKRSLEKLLSISWFDKLDRYLMSYSINRWKKIYGNYLETEDFKIAFQSTPNVSRSHPEFYQKKVLKLYEQKISDFEQQHEIVLS